MSTRLKRAVSVDEIKKMVFKVLQLNAFWQKILGLPEASGVWIIWGKSGSGKSRFNMILAKMLTEFEKVAYNSLEEGARLSLQKNINDCKMIEVKEKFVILAREPIPELKERLRKKRRPGIVFIDSLQYTGLTKKEYLSLKEEFTDVLFIFISHANGTEPKGSVAEFIRYDADIKIRVEGFKAFPISRYGGGEPFVIWPEAAAEYWNDLTN
ncbi:ATP-binding protein [Flavobacterium kingsejongi]|uniref:AAA+ ATPase domain-containing protein n=1 Tax=Flavobacterium kingsejongi TaxID=1678728 RepID=A0A2S1LMR8_9FLAO|nr:ATP-binding protein [Flavobacterium kingsejongi]AWG24804.1 hypothetical protein FK004_05965 [Flavobacterium kingsejongi]AWG25050.1 hypothetical protein FK004_07290 [Flavobacterium kingsejongi]